MKKILLLLVVLVFFLQTGNVCAQGISNIDPGAIRERSNETQEYYRLEKKLREQKKSGSEEDRIEDKTQEETKQSLVADEKIFISRIETGSSEILSPAEINGITYKYEGKKVSMKDLFEAIREINALYVAKKFIAARAVLPPQKVEKGVVRIELIESHVGKILVEDNKHTKNSFFTKRISLKNGDLVRVDQLDKDIFFINNTNDVGIKVALKAGEALGTTDCIVKVREPQKYQMTFFSDNAGRDTVGLYRFGLAFASNSLFGYTDRLSLNAFLANHKGTTAGSGSYSIPVSTRGTRLSVSYDYNQIKVISGPYEVLNISGNSSELGLDVTHPFIVESAIKLNGFTGVHFKKSATDFDDVTLFQNKVRTLNLGVDVQFLDESGYWYFNHKLTRGFKNLGGEARFLKYNLFFSRQQKLGEDFVFIFRGSAQLSNSTLLPSSEQFQIGGSSSVRGYPEGFLTGDRGYMVNGELYFPLPFAKNGNFDSTLGDKLKGVVFVDHGGAFPYKADGGSSNHNDYLLSAGAGLMMNISKYLTGRLNLGVPLKNRNKVESNYLLHFYLQSNFL